MTTLSQASPTATALQKERLLFREIFDRLLDTLLNNIFDLRPEKAQSRMRNLTILFLASGLLLTLHYYPPLLWAQQLQALFLYLLNPAYAAQYPNGEPLTQFFTLVFQALTDAHILQYLPIFLAPFFIAQQLAAIYLADIFELEDVSVARKFVSEVALSGSDETIRISKGQIADKDRESPNFLIGGPGKVMVDLDSVALFERADGTPHVIGPTGKEAGGKATIAGFERFRQALDIRDQHVELRDQDNKSESVKGRSRDGIPITATDVRLMFSIYRGENSKPSAEFPYPFAKEAIEHIVYKSSSKVTPDQKEPSAYQFEWIGNMIGLIRGRLGGFMSERNLTEYLANIGTPELEKAKQREELIAEQVRKLAQPDDESKSKSPKLPQFTPRREVTNLFSQFTTEFTKSARNNGVELHWIGVGTWKTPPEISIVSENHLEAWQISQSNLKNGSEDAMKGAEGEATLQKMESLIRAVPIESYYDITGYKKQYGKKQDKKKDFRFFETDNLDDYIITEDEMKEVLSEKPRVFDITKFVNERIAAAAEQRYKEPDKESDQRGNMRRLLLEYRKQLMEAVQFVTNKGEQVPPSIQEAINYINKQMGFKHWAGRP